MKTLGWTALAALAALGVGAAVIAGAIAWLGPLAPFDDSVLHFDDMTLTLSPFGPIEWLATVGVASVGLMIAFLAVAVVVPLALLLPLLVAGLVLVLVLVPVLVLVLSGALIAVLGALVFAGSPLILLAAGGWLVWRLARRPAAPRDGSAEPASVRSAAQNGLRTGLRTGRDSNGGTTISQ